MNRLELGGSHDSLGQQRGNEVCSPSRRLQGDRVSASNMVAIGKNNKHEERGHNRDKGSSPGA